MSIARNGLQHAYAVIFGVNERDVLADARYLHRLTQHLAAGFENFQRSEVLNRPVGNRRGLRMGASSALS
jgi:hypothetical protein